MAVYFCHFRQDDGGITFAYISKFMTGANLTANGIKTQLYTKLLKKEIAYVKRTLFIINGGTGVYP